MNRPVVLFAHGVLLTILGALMGIPVLLEFLLTGIVQASEFLLPMICCIFVGLSFVFSNGRPSKPRISAIDALMLTSLTWVSLPLFAGLPFYFCVPAELSFVDAWFEAVAALTTTGCSMIQKLDILPRWIVMWRFLLAYIGGVGVIVMGMLIFPALRMGGMQLFRSESSEHSEKMFPSMTQLSLWILSVYTGAIFVCFLGLKACHMHTLEAICHAISSISTCGFSTRAAPLSEWMSFPCRLILAFGMLFGGSSLLLSIRFLKGRFVSVRQDTQFHGYLKAIGGATLVLTFARWQVNHTPFFQSLQDGFLHAISMITTTGFEFSDISTWGTYAGVLFLFMGMVGGSTGSTSGGIKIYRWQILWQSLKIHIKQLRQPHGVFILTYNQKPVSNTLSDSIFLFVVLYFVIFSVAACVLSLCGLPLSQALSASLASLSNLGVGFEELASTLKSISLTAKIVIMACMVLGRLELLTLLTLILPSFWKK